MDPIISVIFIDKHSSVPLHAQLRECIRTAIRSGLLAPGDKLPTEEELCSQFAISRPVVRQAYAQLAAEQMIERRRGHGSYVKNVNADTLKLYQLLSFEEEMQLLGKRPGTRLISSETAPGSPQIRRLLQMEDGDLCFRIRRLRTADGLPFCLVDNYVSLARFPAMTNAYSPRLIRLAQDCARQFGITLRQGVYVGLQGPSFETPAEYNWLRIIGGDAVGMSTIPEILVARHMGMECFGISVITNSTAKPEHIQTSHAEVQDVGNAAQPRLSALLKEIISQL